MQLSWSWCSSVGFDRLHREVRGHVQHAGQADERSEALAALKISGSVGLAVFPIGIAFGMLVTHSGLAWWWASVFSSVIFAGVGALLGMIIPARITGLDFVMTALFAVLAMDAFRARRDIPTSVLAVACAPVQVALATALSGR
jgi:predicted branched-subunit amino acid permease